MKLSKYNFYEKSNIKGGYIYNTNTGAILHINDENYWNFITDSDIENFDDETENNLLNMQMMLEDDIDEFQKVRNRYLENINDEENLHLTIMPTDGCNFACPYCFSYEKGCNVMSDETYTNILKLIELKSNKLKRVVISWFGGEPTLATEKIISFMNKAKEFCKNKNIELYSSIITNGYLLDKDNFIRMYESGIRQYQVTLDGNKLTHDKMRYLKGFKPTFDKIINNLEDISSIGNNYDFKFDIRCNVTKANHESAISLIHLFDNLFSDDRRFRIYFRPVYNYETKNNEIKSMVNELYDMDEGIEMQNQMSMLTEKVTKRVSKRRLFNPLPLPTNSWCAAELKNFFLIGPNGNLFFCDTLTGDDNSYGNLKDLINGTKINKPDGNIFNSEHNAKCIQCKLLPICYGGCMRNRINKEPECYWTIQGIQNSFAKFIDELERGCDYEN